MGLIIVVQKSLNKAGIETMNKMRVINRQTGDIFNVKVNPYLPSISGYRKEQSIRIHNKEK
jgi:hypothetical protein